jgi:hypothetical protein
MANTFVKSHLIETVSAISAVAINVLLWLLAIFLFPQDKAAAVLHYNASLGIDFIGAGSQIKILPTIGTAIIILNLILAFSLRRVSRRATTMLWAILPIIEAMLIVAFWLILRLNT